MIQGNIDDQRATSALSSGHLPCRSQVLLCWIECCIPGGVWPFCCHLSDKKVLVPRLTWFYFLSPNGSENQVICQTTSVSCFGCLCSFCSASSWLVWSGLISDGAGVVEGCAGVTSCGAAGFDGSICASCSGVMFLASSSCFGVILAPLRSAKPRLAPLRLALLRSALLRLAAISLALLRFALLRLAVLSLALLRLAPLRLAAVRLAPLRSMLFKSALLRSSE